MNKPDFQHEISDIEKAQPKKIMRNASSVDYTLKVDDIAGTKPRINKFSSSRQPSNPLEPKYSLPKFDVIDPPPRNFIRDSIDVSDIDGTRPNPHVWKPRKENIYIEVEGSVPKKSYSRNQLYDSLNVKDINHVEQ